MRWQPVSSAERARTRFPYALPALVGSLAGVGLLVLGAGSAAAGLPSADAVTVALGTVTASTAALTITPKGTESATAADLTLYNQSGKVIDSSQSITGLPDPTTNPPGLTWSVTANYSDGANRITGLAANPGYEQPSPNSSNTVLLSVYTTDGLTPSGTIVPFVVPPPTLPVPAVPPPTLPVPAVPPATSLTTTQPVLPQTGGGRMLEALGVVLVALGGWMAFLRPRRP